MEDLKTLLESRKGKGLNITPRECLGIAMCGTMSL